MARAIISLPVPLSPWISTVLRRLATSWHSARMSRMRGFLVTMSCTTYWRLSFLRRMVFSRCRFFTLMMRLTSSEISSGLQGFTMYSCAPSFMAVIAVSTVAYAVMMMMEASGRRRRICIMVSMPSIPPGIFKSTK